MKLIIVVISILLLLGSYARLPAEQEKPVLVIPSGHFWEISSLAVSPDGTRLVSTGYGEMIVWNVKTGRCFVNLYNDQLGGIYAAAFSPTGKLLAINCEAGIIIWNLQTLELVTTIEQPGSEEQRIIFSPDELSLARSDAEKTSVWKIATGELQHEFMLDAGEIEDLDIAAESFLANDRIAVALYCIQDENIVVRTWNPVTGQVVGDDSPAMGATSVSALLSTDGTRLVTDNVLSLTVWEVATGKSITEIPLDFDWINSLTADADMRMIEIQYSLMGDDDEPRDNGMLLWNLAEKKAVLEQVPVLDDSYYEDPAPFLPDNIALSGDTLYASSGYVIAAWDKNTGKSRPSLGEGSTRWMPQTAAWQKDALLLGTMDAGISCLPFNTRETLAWITSDVDARLVRALPDGKHLATLGIGAVSVVLIETKTGEIEAELKPGHGTISSLDTSTDGKLLASLSQQADEATDQVTTKIAIWDIATQKLMHEILTDHNISSIRFGADNNSLVGLGAAEILVWDISGAGVPAPRVVSVDDTALPVDYAPKKHLAALASVDKVVIVDVDTGARLRTLSPLSDKIRLLSFSPDGGLLVVGTESGKLVVYDTADGTMKYDFSEQQSALPDFLTFSPDGKTLGAGGYRDWRFWNLKDGKLLGALVLYQPDEWVALDAENNFDASPGAMSRLFWQVGNRQVDLADYKKKYYTPGLLKKWLQQK